MDSTENRPEFLEDELSDFRAVNSECNHIWALIGTTLKGMDFVQDLGQIPHLLVCGFSGSGKTAFIQSVITSVAQRYSPQVARFFLYDSKGVDYQDFCTLPHLLCPVISNQKKATMVFNVLATEVRKRYTVFSEAGVKNFFDYNVYCESNKSQDFLPHLFVVLDDFSELDSSVFDEEAFLEILKNGRSTGIHVIMVTSLISHKVLQKDIMANIVCRVSFCVSTRANSRSAIGQGGAENLRVPGELIFKDSNQTVLCQGTYLSDGDFQDMVQCITKKYGQATAFMINPDQMDSLEENDASSEEDTLLNDAIHSVMEAGMASTSFLQRRLKIDYVRAARLMDQLEQMQIIGPYRGAQPRHLLVSAEQPKERAETGFASESQVTESPKIISRKYLRHSSVPFLRDFPICFIDNRRIRIVRNRVQITTNGIQEWKKDSLTIEFGGGSIQRLIYHKPSLLSVGYIQFCIDAKTANFYKNGRILCEIPYNLNDLLKLRFLNREKKKMWQFLSQIAEDVGIAISKE